MKYRWSLCESFSNRYDAPTSRESFIMVSVRCLCILCSVYAADAVRGVASIHWVRVRCAGSNFGKSARAPALWERHQRKQVLFNFSNKSQEKKRTGKDIVELVWIRTLPTVFSSMPCYAALTVCCTDGSGVVPPSVCYIDGVGCAHICLFRLRFTLFAPF